MMLEVSGNASNKGGRVFKLTGIPRRARQAEKLCAVATVMHGADLRTKQSGPVEQILRNVKGDGRLDM